MKKQVLLKQLVLPIALCLTLNVLSQTVTVSNCNLNGWTIFTEPTGTVSFVTGPATPPLPVGSVHFSLGTDGNGKAALVTLQYLGTPLASLTELSYWTYVTNNQGAQAPALEIRVDTNSNGLPDDNLVFEPIYQNGTFGPVQNATTITLNTWQFWNALVGGWWAASDPTSGPATYTLASYLAAHPNTTILAVMLTTGGGNTWNNFTGNADALKIRIGSGTTTTYNFEPCEQQEEDKKVTVCHNGKTITIGKNALESHLRHGDQLGPCTISRRPGNPKTKMSNFPNPFHNTTHIRYTLQEDTRVTIKIYDAAGHEVTTLLNSQQQSAGEHKVRFDARELEAGIYYYTIIVQSSGGQYSETKSMQIVK